MSARELSEKLSEESRMKSSRMSSSSSLAGMERQTLSEKTSHESSPVPDTTREYVDYEGEQPIDKRQKVNHINFEVADPAFEDWEVKENYELMLELGKGSYGAVAKARER